MSKRVLLIVFIVVIVTVALLGIALKGSNIPSVTPSPPPTSAIMPLTTLMINPATLDLKNGSSGVLQVDIDSSTNEITGVQLELQYDPKALTNVTIEPGPFLPDPLILRNKITKETGRISLILGVTPQQNPVKGKGTVATIHFTKLPSTLTETDFTILPSSEVTAEGVDTTVLHNAVGAKLFL